MQRALAVLVVSTFLLAADGRAVIVAPGDGTQNTTAPADDPGFANVGTEGPLSVVYVGNGWVVTASHVGVGTVSFGGVSYAAVPGSQVTFETSPGVAADLIAFKLRTIPPLPSLAIASAAPTVGTSVVMIGHGRDRGAATQWNGIDGWLWATTATKRWGTNLVASAPANVTIGSLVTRAFPTDFTRSPPSQVTAQEAQAAYGDSGGALFAKSGGTWQLAGILFATAGFSGQPDSTALYGNATYAIDLSTYRSAILAVTTRPACNDGLDDDGDGLVDYPSDPGCASASDLDEHSPLLVCDDGADNDGDGLADYPADPGCLDPTWRPENPACSNGIDDDGDGGIDFDGGPAHGAPDPQCLNQPWRTAEAPTCGLGVELVALLPLVTAARRRRMRA